TSLFLKKRIFRGITTPQNAITAFKDDVSSFYKSENAELLTTIEYGLEPYSSTNQIALFVLYHSLDTRGKAIIRENWANIILSIKGHRTFLEIEKIYKINHENRWSKMVVEHIKILENLKRSEIYNTKQDDINDQYYLIVDNQILYADNYLSIHATEWIDSHINDTECTEFDYAENEPWIIEFLNTFKNIQEKFVCFNIEDMSEKSWHIEVLYPMFGVLVSGLKYLKFKMDKSFTKLSQEASRESSISLSIHTTILSTCSNNDNICGSKFVFVNLNADHFSETHNTTNGIRPDGKLISLDG
ncbi:14785_t:CDS:2, partial [Gigaspora margarita]